VSAFYWARRVTRAPMALMNMVSSNINQWTVLAAMIPLVYGYSSLRHHGVWLDFHFDGPQRLEILLTLPAIRASDDGAREHGVRLARRERVVRAVAGAVPATQPARSRGRRLWGLDGDSRDRIRVGRKTLLAPRYFWEIIRKRDRPVPL